jgi:hypothetical protein
MNGLLVNPSGNVSILQDVTEAVLEQLLGEQREEVSNQNNSCNVYVHELWTVADLPINVHASVDTGLVIGGPVVIVPRAGSDMESALFASSFHNAILKQNTDKNTLARLEDLFERNRIRANFKLYEDRWLYNGKAFDSIIVAESDSHMERGTSSYMLWFFSKERKDPYLLRIDEYSLREVMEGMILDDEATARGNPPEHFRRILLHFGRS